jgi:hypothetical protein
MTDFFKPDDFRETFFLLDHRRIMAQWANKKLADEGVRVKGFYHPGGSSAWSDDFDNLTHTAILIGIEPIKPVEPKCDHIFGEERQIKRVSGGMEVDLTHYKFCPDCGEALS